MWDAHCPDPEDAQKRWDEIMYYLNLLNMHGFSGNFYLKMVHGHVSRVTWKRVVHVARGYLAHETKEEMPCQTT